MHYIVVNQNYELDKINSKVKEEISKIYSSFFCEYLFLPNFYDSQKHFSGFTNVVNQHQKSTKIFTSRRVRWTHEVGQHCVKFCIENFGP